jgi:hypothetical protein
VVTSLSAHQPDPRTLDEDLCCARGDLENRIKEQQLDLFTDRTRMQSLRPTRSGSTSPRSPMCCCAPCIVRGYNAPRWRVPNAAASSCSR